jgi:hypothetical protein
MGWSIAIESVTTAGVKSFGEYGTGNTTTSAQQRARNDLSAEAKHYSQCDTGGQATERSDRSIGLLSHGHCCLLGESD